MRLYRFGFIAFFLTTSNHDAKNPDEKKLIVNREYGFSLEIPANWEKPANSQEGEFVCFSSPNGYISGELSARHLDWVRNGISNEREWIENHFRNLPQLRLKAITDHKTKIGACVASEYSSIEPTENIEYTGIMITCLNYFKNPKDRRIWTLNIVHQKESVTDFGRELIQEIVNSLQLNRFSW